MFEPKPPDYYRNWKAIDIYLFDNGQSYSPPRKYHLVADQLEWWPVTLNYLASAQYGLVDRAIDLYTIDGHKIVTPLELKNETAYVAVKPPEPFIKADYEKYLVRASKSWDKRQSLREHSDLNANTQNSHTPVTSSDTSKIQKETSDVNVFQANSIQTPEESLLIQTILANKSVEKPNFIIVKPTDNTDKRISQNNMPILPTIKQNGDKRHSTQHFPGNKNPGSLSQPVPVRKPSFKRRENIKLSDAKITPPPDIDQKNNGSVRYSGSRGESSTEGNLPNKGRIHKSISNRRNSTQPALSKVDEVMNELKKYSSEKDPNVKNTISLKENEISTTDHKNPDFNADRDFSAIYIDVTTLKQFKNNLTAEKSKETPDINRDSPNKIVGNEIVNELKQGNIQARDEQIHSREVATALSVSNATNKTESREMITDTSVNNPLDLANKVNDIMANSTHVNVKDNLKPNSLMAIDQFTHNVPNVLSRVEVLSVADKYTNIQDNALKLNSQINNSKPANVVLTSENKIKDHHTKPASIITFQKTVNNGSNEAHKTDFTLINDKIPSVKNNPAKLVNQNATNKSGDVVSSNVNKNQDTNPEPTSEITIENFVDNNIENMSSAVYRAEVVALNGNYINVQASTVALSSEVTTSNSVDKSSSTDALKMLSVRDKNENMQDNPPRSANEGSDRIAKKVSTSVGREDVVNLKLSIDIWNHNSTINSRPTVASMSHSPYISKQNESQRNVPVESNVIHKPLNTWNAANEANLKDDQKIIVIKYVPRHSKDEKQNSNENPKSNGNNKDFIIILPILQLDNVTGCCSHCQKEPKNDEENPQKTQQRASSIKYPVRRTTSCMSLLNILTRFEKEEVIDADAPVNQSKEPSTVNEGTNPSIDPNNSNKDMNPFRISSSIYKDTSPSKDRSSIPKDKVSENRESFSKRKSVAINEQLTSKEPSYTASGISDNTNKDQLIVIHDKEFETEKTFDKAIQTDWCNLVMEARRQEDGHYALFLPSIEMLKQCKLVS